MSRAKTLIVAIVGVLALSAFTSALASAAPGWMVNGTTLTTTAAIATTAAVDEKGVLTAASVTVTCSGTTLKGSNPTINGSTSMGDAQSLEFTNCAGNATCPLGINQGSTVNTLPVLVDLTLDGTTAVKGKFLPTNSSKLFATIEFEGAKCSFAGVQGVTGTQAFLAPTGQEEKAAQQLNAVTETSGELKLASTAATLKGSILVRLANGGTFSFL